MFLIRRAKIDDAGTLLKLGKMVHFINLPPDKDIITQKIVHSRNCFIRVATGASAKPTKRVDSGMGLAAASAGVDMFMFVLEDTDTGNCLGTSQLLAQMGGIDNPNIALKLERRQFFSTSLQTGTTQIVARYHEDASCPTEIGGLILQPSLRGHKHRLGLLLSLVRFHFIALQRERFSDRILAEMMAPITPHGTNLFWEAVGRRFIPLSYDEADRFCQYSREFMTSLMPRQDIYLSLLPATARAGVGQVNRETLPARRMLEKIGFTYNNVIDPFDGGPHLEVNTDDVGLIRNTRTLTLAGSGRASQRTRRGIVSILDSDGDFRAFQCAFALERNGKILLPRDVIKALHAEPGARVGVTPTDDKPLRTTSPRPSAKKTSPKNTTPKQSSTKKTAKKRRSTRP